MGSVAVAIVAVILPEPIHGEEVVAGEVPNLLFHQIAPLQLIPGFKHEGGGDGVGFFPVSGPEEILEWTVVEQSIGGEIFDRGLRDRFALGGTEGDHQRGQTEGDGNEETLKIHGSARGDG